MKFLVVASLLFASTLAVPTSQCGECQKHHQPGVDNPGGDNPGGNTPGGDTPGGNNPGGNNPGGNNPGGNNPGGNNPGNYKPCPSGLYSNPQCCALDILGVASVDCKNPSTNPSSADDFRQACADKEPQCCVLPVVS